MGLHSHRESEPAREGHSHSLLSRDAPWPAVSRGCPVASTERCTVITKCESYISNLLQNVWVNCTIFSKSYWSIPLGVWAAQAICPCMQSQALHLLNAFPVTTAWASPHDNCRLIQLRHVQPSQLSHQLSVFTQTANNSYFHLQRSPAKSNFPRIFKHRGHFVDRSWRKKQTLNSKETFSFTQKASFCLCSSHLRCL